MAFQSEHLFERTVTPMCQDIIDDIKNNGTTYHLSFDGCNFVRVVDGTIWPVVPVAPSITLASPQAGIYENGESVWPVVLNATVTPGTNPVTSIDFFNGATNIQSGLSTTATDTWPFTTDQTRHATATDGTLTWTSNDVSISFLSKFYYGMDANTSIDETWVEALEYNQLKASFTGVYAFASVLSEYKYFARPVSLWQPSDETSDFKDNDTWLSIPFQLQGTISITNTLWYTENYYVYRSVNILWWALNIQVQP